MKLFDQLTNNEIQFPPAVRCAHCGQTAELEDRDSDPGHLEMAAYLCIHCEWYTEWEITSDGEGGIHTSALYYRHADEESSLSWYEVRHWPYFWMLGEDGWTLPLGVLKTAGEAA